MSKFKHVISLGFFCSVALEIEKTGLRGASYPFDWIISDFKGVIECIDNNFYDFLNYNNLAQYEREKGFYYDKKYNFHFYHDFSKYIDLKNQLNSVKEKYERRIERFKNDVKEPTLFLRYIENNEELKYIEKNYQYINDLLKRFNKSNELLLISNNDINSSLLEIYNVEKDINDSVARKFLEKNIKLREYLLSDIYDYNEREINIKRYIDSQKNKKIMRHQKMLKRIYDKIFRKVYIHNEIVKF